MVRSRPAAGAALPPEVLAQVRNIQFTSHRLVGESMAGPYHSAFRGRGMQFEQIRGYVPGDDVRHIDWNVTARYQLPFVKEFREERELTVMLAVDVSPSGAFGSLARTKIEVAAEVAAVLAHLASIHRDRVGLVLFSDRIEATLPPRHGRAHVWRLIRDILTFVPQQRGTRVRVALDHLSQAAPRGAITFLISDFLDPALGEGLAQAAARVDLTAVWVTDGLERALPPPGVGIVALQDCETGEVVELDTSDLAGMRRWRAAVDRRAAAAEAALTRADIEVLSINTADPYAPVLVRFFRRRQRRRGRRG